MTEIGLFLSSEEHGPKELVTQAQRGEAAGFGSVFISDHFHPWIDRQGESPFVWSVIGGIAATTEMKVTTGVTCPLVRIHPAIVAQAAATSQLLLDGRFVFGVGTGEALNEHILGDHWPPVATRLAMLEEAVGLLRQMWEGKRTTHHGRYYTVENARLYSCPDEPPPIVVSAFGPEALEVAARIGDGLVTTQPDGQMVKSYRKQGGAGPTIAALKVCWDSDEARARKQAHELWPTEALAGQLSQELPMPAHFEQAASIVTEEMVADKVACGPDPERHVHAITEYLEAGFDEVYINQIGPDQAGFLEFYRTELEPRIAR
jgi:G6PDH family F420-dependent oxidoreductase